MVRLYARHLCNAHIRLARCKLICLILLNAIKLIVVKLHFQFNGNEVKLFIKKMHLLQKYRVHTLFDKRNHPLLNREKTKNCLSVELNTEK